MKRRIKEWRRKRTFKPWVFELKQFSNGVWVLWKKNKFSSPGQLHICAQVFLKLHMDPRFETFFHFSPYFISTWSLWVSLSWVSVNCFLTHVHSFLFILVPLNCILLFFVFDIAFESLCVLSFCELVNLIFVTIFD